MRKYLGAGLFILMVVTGCSWSGKSIEAPRYDRVLVYERPYDYTYLRTLEALNTFPDWVLQDTDKEKRFI